ncbi:hypothetical protein [Alteromonas facilis]|uniref:hypothetical protein n=1 Tax=Alteromonas facilis TaxID=2048004 RepID=UPI000C2949C1|nr:hypothetical protein [Alteromonas facilis]
MDTSKLKPSSGKISDEEYLKMSGRDRRTLPRMQDTLYRIAIGLNIIGWVCLVAALIIFHFARPELAAGLHEYFNIEVRDSWNVEYVDWLNLLLQGCLGLSLISVLLNQRRSRRASDTKGFSFLLLVIIVVVSFLTLQITVIGSVT